MDDNYVDCKGHSRRGHYGGSGKVRDAGTCKAKECACRRYVARQPAEARHGIHA